MKGLAAARTWSSHAPMYQRGADHVTGRWVSDIVSLASLGDASHCLDVGCGTGVLALELARRGHRVCATDFSEGMVASAAKALAELGVPYEAKVADGHTLEGIEDESYDAVMSNFGLFMIEDRSQGWRSARRVVRPGGKLLASSWDESFPLASAVMKMFEHLNLGPYSNKEASEATQQQSKSNATKNANAFQEEVKAAGFADVRVFSVSHDLVLPSGGLLLEVIADNPMLASVPGEQMSEVKRYLLGEWCGSPIKEENIEDSAHFKQPLIIAGCEAHICVATK